MRWASGRRTTRVEDGILSLWPLRINLPTLYGEGQKAFYRLQEEIMRISGDASLFAWGAFRTFTGIRELSAACKPEVSSNREDLRPMSHLLPPCTAAFNDWRGVQFADMSDFTQVRLFIIVSMLLNTPCSRL